MKIITKISEINLEKWRNFLEGHPNANFFQSYQAYSFFSGIPNFEPFIIALEEEQHLVGVLCGVNISEPGKKSIFSRRIIVWGGPLVKENEQANLLLSTMMKVTAKSIYTEFRNLHDTETYKSLFLSHGFRYKPHLNYQIKITSEEQLQKQLSKSKLRQIRSSLKNGAEISAANSISEVQDFYDILKVLFREKVKKPLPEFSFFESFFSNEDAGRIFLVKYDGRVIGGILCPIYNSKIIYEWYIGAKDGEIKGIYPSVLATWAPIKYAVDNNIQYFDFMGAGSPDSNYGVREFKSKFGGEMVEYGRYIKINKPLLYSVGNVGLKILGKLNNV